MYLSAVLREGDAPDKPILTIELVEPNLLALAINDASNA